jgi:hypothetical protein
MADGGIGVAGIVLAVPGLIDLMIKYGEFIHDKIQTFKNAKGIWADLDTFGLSLCRGNLKALTETAKSFYLEEGCDPALKSSLQSLIERMYTDVKALKEYLEHIDPSSVADRVAVAIVGERRAKRFENSLKTHQGELLYVLEIRNLYQQRVEAEVVLSEKRFVLNEKIGYKAMPGFVNVFEAKGDYRESSLEGELREADVLVERNAVGKASESGLKEIATLLRHRLPDKTVAGEQTILHKGVLRCLGYRMQPQPELMFEMPKDMKSLQTLQSLISADEGVPKHPLDFRFRLARQVAEAVLRVNAATLVHKNIRSNSILVAQKDAGVAGESPGNKTGFGDVYLTNWCLLRRAADATSWTGGDQWAEDIYRHPGRQGTEVQDRYNIGHDVYSLGVCLLEIGMWDCLVLPPQGEDGRPQVSKLFRAAATSQDGKAGDEELQSKLKRPTKVREILLKLAAEHLEAKVGIEYKKLVVACLTGLDDLSGFGPEVKFAKMNTVEQGVAFKELVLAFFTDMSM